MMQISQGTLGTPWHQTYHSSSSTSDLSSYDPGYMRRSPDQYSSRGSMESLDHTHAGYHCHLSPAKSTNSIDQLAQLHNKRDSAYSSFSTNSSIPEYQLPAFCKERSFSMENMHSRCSPHERMKQADIKYIKTVYDAQRGVSEEYEVNSSSLHKNREGKTQAENRSFGRSQAKNRNSSVPAWNQHNRSVSETDSIYKGPPLPPARSDSYAAIKHRETASSWLCHDQNTSCQTQTKGAWPQPLSGTSSAPGQLHTVLEKSPESSPTVKSKQNYSQAPQPGQPMYPTGVYPVPTPEPHFALAPQLSSSNAGMLYPALAKESGYVPPPPTSFHKVTASDPSSITENINQTTNNRSTVFSDREGAQPGSSQKQDGMATLAQYKPHSISNTDIPTISPGRSKGESGPLNYLLQGSREITKQTQYSTCVAQAPKTHLRSASESKAHSQPSEHWRSEVQEEREANLWRRERDALTRTQWASGKTKPGNASLQSKPDISRRQHSIEVKELQQRGAHSGSKLSTHNKAGEDERGQDNELTVLDRQNFTRHNDGTTSTIVLHSPQPTYEQPSSPIQTKAYELSRNRLSSSSTQSSQGFQFGRPDGSRSRCSVLEKISKIEQREQQNQRFHSTGGTSNNYNNGLNRSSQSSSARSSLNSIEDLRSKFTFQDEAPLSDRTRSASTTTSEKTPRTQTLRRTTRVKSEDAQWHPLEAEGSGKQFAKSEDYCLNPPKEMQGRTTEPQGSKCTLKVMHYDDADEHWKSDAQDNPASQHDNLSNRTYRNSIKDAQSKVLRATSFRRKDLDISPPFVNKSKKITPRPTSAQVGGKSGTVSPHAPKERHSITPTETSVTPQEYSSKEHHVGTQQVSRIGGRKRMSVEQKKRSYSEPEKMNEVGVSDSEPSPHCDQKKGMHFTFQENTVADRRRIFEKENKACSTINLSRPELKQLQQNALADYIERKTGRRPSSQETRFFKERSESSYFQPHMLDDRSISSASSMNSLQDQGLLYSWRDPGEQREVHGRVSSTLPPGLTGCFDLNSFEHKTEYQESRSRSSSFANLPKIDKRPDGRFNLDLSRVHGIDQHVPLGHSPCAKMERPLERPAQARKSGKSASAEDLLERSDQQTIMLHVRSRSSPLADAKSQDLMLRRGIHEYDNLAKDHVGSGDTEVSPFKNKIFSEKAESPTHPYSQRDINASEKQLQATADLPLQMHSRRSSEYQTHGRTAGTGPSADLSGHLTAIKKGLGSCYGEASRAGTVPTPTNDSIHPSTRRAAEGECPIVEQPGKAVSAVKGNKGMTTSPVDWRSHGNISPEGSKEENVKKKPSPPQRPPPPKIKWANSVNEDNLAKKSSGPPVPGQKFLPRWQSLGAQSSSSSEPETPLGPSSSHGKISLRISESCLQITPPLPNQDDEDDEVFVMETELGRTEATFEPPLPPPPAPSLEDGSFSTGIEEFPLPPPDVYEEDVQLEGNHSGIEAGAATRTFTEVISEQEKPVLRIFSGEASWAKSFNSEPPLLHSGSVKTSCPVGLNVQQHLSDALGEPPNTEQLPRALRESTLGETTPTQGSGKSPLCSESHSSTYVKMKTLTQEEMKSLALAKEIVSKDKSLADVLDPDSKMKTTMDLMQGLFPKGSSFLKESNAKRKKMQKSLNRSPSEEDKKEEKEVPGNVVNCNAYCSVSAPNAELLNTIKDLQEDTAEEDQLSLNEKKNELMDNLNYKLNVFNDAKQSLLSDIKLNNVLGEDVEALIKGLCKPNEFDKYKMFIGDLDKVVNLLLSLSGRLARVENVLNGLGEDATAEEKNVMNGKRKVLAGQHEDARELKENLDRRERVVLNILSNYLSDEQLEDYQHFVKMKSALLIEQRELDDKIRLVQEQLTCLMESLPREYSPKGAAPSTGTSATSAVVIKVLPTVTSSL